MANIKITQADIENLAHKLDLHLADLSEHEKALLQGVFALAGSAIEKARDGGKANRETTLSMTGPVGPLSVGFKEAFHPGSSAAFEARNRREDGDDPHIITWTRGSVSVGI